MKRFDNSNVAGERAIKPALLQVEAAPEDITITLEGKRHTITAVNRVPEDGDWLVVFTAAWGESVLVPADGVAVQVVAGNLVTRVVNEAPVGIAPEWKGPTELGIPVDGFVLVARDGLYASESSRFFLATCFRKGDRIRLRRNGTITNHFGLAEVAEGELRLFLNNPLIYTETETSSFISGGVCIGSGKTGAEGMEGESGLAAAKAKKNHLDVVAKGGSESLAASINGDRPIVAINGETIAVDEQGSFEHRLELAQGLNFADVTAKAGHGAEVAQSMVIFARKQETNPRKRIILWVDQRANSVKLRTREAVRELLERAGHAGVTDIALDVKGVEGYVSYLKNPLTSRPHLSELRNSSQEAPFPRLDLLQAFIEEGHALGLRIHASMNVFAEGSIVRSEYAILDEHPDWEEIVCKHHDEGALLRQRESSAPGFVAFVNPAHDEARAHQLAGLREVVEGYEVDGIILDRGRYDNETADFSPLTRRRFEAYLADRGKQLLNWPEDIFRYEGNTRIDGSLALDWWAFRAGIITGFVSDVKKMIAEHNGQTGGNVLLSAYVGSWYDTYYVNGANWASTDFQYNNRLQFQEGSIYTNDYVSTGYIRHLDFLMIGTYQDTLAEVEKYMTIGNIATRGEIPMYAGIALNGMKTEERQKEVFEAALRNTDGLMLFDASHADWGILDRSLK
ncbi:family 10 glycosylhydrolase [Paenibacillus sp. CAU 1782]